MSFLPVTQLGHFSSSVPLSFKCSCVCIYLSLNKMPNTHPLNLITFKKAEWQRRRTGSQRPLRPMAGRLNSVLQAMARMVHANVSPLGRVINCRRAERRTVRVAFQVKVHLRSRK